MINDTISRQDAIDLWEQYRPYIAIKACEYDTMLRQLPSTQPIIRCKCCQHSKEWYKDKRRCFLWHEEGIDVFEDGYCNYAERRTE